MFCPQAGRLAGLVLGLMAGVASLASEPDLKRYQEDIEPILDQYCFDCHGGGKKKGNVSLESFTTPEALQDHELWLRVLKNTRAGIMPPQEEEPLPPDLAAKLSSWIKLEAFGLNPQRPDPGRVTVRRLNRVEYRNTIRDLLGYDFDTEKEFPADDTGHGFDNNGDVLTISPMLLEKYLDAAQAVIAATVPVQPKVPAKQWLLGKNFTVVRVDHPEHIDPQDVPAGAKPEVPANDSPGGVPPATTTATVYKRPPPAADGNSIDLSYYTPATIAMTHPVKHAGKFQLLVSLHALEQYVDDQFDLNRCRFVLRDNGETLLEREYVRESSMRFEFEFDREWPVGERKLEVEIIPLGPDREQKRNLRIRLHSLVVRGPLAEEHWVQTPGYRRHFPGNVPVEAEARQHYARDVLRNFATRAYRRPVDEATLDRLVRLVAATMAEPGRTFEAGLAQAMTAVLASPRFIFREEFTEPTAAGQTNQLIDEYSLASRLSYFLWSTMPDAELFRLADERKLRAELPAQIDRMLKDPRSDEFVRNFTGQWLQARDIGTVAINQFEVFMRENPNPGLDRARETFQSLVRIPEAQRTPEQKVTFEEARKIFRSVFRMPMPTLTEELREAMREETQKYFSHVLRENRSLLELLDSDYTFLNEDLAKHYGIDGVTGNEVRKVTLPADSWRGGVLTQGTVLAVTSNPTRTSPVKRGVFLLEAILGTPPAPPPPNIPALEDVASKEDLKKMSLRDTLALHAKNVQCRSCHNRMDPLGLALENFNAMGRWRDTEMNQPIAPEGTLITGESFKDIRELKRILATSRSRDFYYNMSEKLLTYALGRGVEYYDTATLDQLVSQLESDGGRPVALIQGIINSPAFQQRRPAPPPSTVAESTTPTSAQPVSAHSL